MVTSQKNLEEFINKELTEIFNLFRSKSNQYSTDDALANFRKGSLLATGKDDLNSLYKTALSYENKHVVHVYNHDINGSKVDESLKDIIVYSLIELYMYELHKKL